MRRALCGSQRREPVPATTSALLRTLVSFLLGQRDRRGGGLPALSHRSPEVAPLVRRGGAPWRRVMCRARSFALRIGTARTHVEYCATCRRRPNNEDRCRMFTPTRVGITR